MRIAINNKRVIFYCSFFIILLPGVNADAMNYSSAWVRLALVYYKNFPCHEIKTNAPVPGCILRTDSAGSHHMFWHCQEKIYLLRPLSAVASWNKKRKCPGVRFSALKINHIQAKIISFHFLQKHLIYRLRIMCR